MQFVFNDCYIYLALYLAKRGSSWKLRLSSLKQMAPLFTAFDNDKSTWTDKIQNWYQSLMINMKPLRRTATILDYSKLLFNQYVLEHYKS